MIFYRTDAFIKQIDTSVVKATKLFNVGICTSYNNAIYTPCTFSLTHERELLFVNVWKEGTPVSISVTSDNAKITQFNNLFGSTGCDTIVCLIEGKIGQTVTITHTASYTYSCLARFAYYGKDEFSFIDQSRTNGQIWTIPESGKMLIASNNWREGGRGEGTCTTESSASITLLNYIDSINYTRTKYWYVEGEPGNTVKVSFDGGYPYSVALQMT